MMRLFSIFLPRRVGCVLFSLALTGCAGFLPTEPWVAPYERELLTDPLMTLESEPVVARLRNHVHEVREASRGATGSQGGGCGCN